MFGERGRLMGRLRVDVGVGRLERGDKKRPTKCLCIQAAYFPTFCVAGRKIAPDPGAPGHTAILARPTYRSGKSTISMRQIILLEAPRV